MPSSLRDSGYVGSESASNVMDRSPTHGHRKFRHSSGAFTIGSQSDVLFGHYRDNRSSVSGYESVVNDPQYSSSDFLPGDLDSSIPIDPSIMGPGSDNPWLAGLGTNTNPLKDFDQITIDGPGVEQNISQRLATQQNSTSYVPASEHPWNPCAVEDDMGPKRRMSPSSGEYLQAKRIRSSYGEIEITPQDQIPVNTEHASTDDEHLAGRAPDPYYRDIPPTNYYQPSMADFIPAVQPQHIMRSVYETPQDIQEIPLSNDSSSPDRSKKAKTQGRILERKHECQKCPQGEKSFKTINDLQRHERTVHGLLNKGDRIYICCVNGCSVQKKIWPRLDNFKQHVSRMHKEIRSESAEEMGVSYDPKEHADFEVAKGKNRMPQNSNVATRSERSKDLDRSPGLEESQHSRAPHPSSRKHTRAGVQHLRQHHSTPRSSTANNVGSRSSVNASAKSTGSPSFQPMQYEDSAMSGYKTARTNDRQNMQQSQHHITSRHTTTNAHDLAEQHRTFQNFLPESRYNLNAEGFENAEQEVVYAGLASDLAINGYDTYSLPGLAMTDNSENKIDLDGQTGPSAQNSAAWIRGQIQSHLNSAPPETLQKIMDVLQGNLEFRRSISTDRRSDSMLLSRKQHKANVLKGAERHVCDEETEVKGRNKPCGKIYSTRAELNKHKKRHEKKYGCTFDKCYKRFGTKWEWKRHERDQHIQQENWRCRTKSGSTVCGHLCQDETSFKEHLAGLSHRLPADKIDEETKACRIATKWFGTFWCGFCKKIQVMPAGLGSGQPMWDFRWEHVANHIEANDRDRHDPWNWVELGGKGKLKREQHALEQEEDMWPPLAGRGHSPNGEAESRVEDGDDSDGEERGRYDQDAPSTVTSMQRQPRLDTSIGSYNSQLLSPGSQHSRRRSPNTPSLLVTPAEEDFPAFTTAQTFDPDHGTQQQMLQQQFVCVHGLYPNVCEICVSNDWML